MKKIYLLTLFLASVAMAQFPNKLWDKAIGTSSTETMTCAITTSDGGMLLGGNSAAPAGGHKSQNGQGQNDYWIIKLDANGQRMWDLTLGGSTVEELGGIAQTADGGYILAGASSSPADGDKSIENVGAGFDYWIVKLNADRSIAWQKSYGGNGHDKALAVHVLSDGAMIVGGSTASAQGTGNKTALNKGGNDMWVHKLNASGDKIWETSLGSINTDSFYGMDVNETGEILVSGISNGGATGDKLESAMGSWDAWIIKLNSDGSMAWQNAIGGGAQDLPYDVIHTVDGGCIAAVTSASIASDDKSATTFGGYDMWIVKLGATGSIEWDHTYGGSGHDYAQNIIKDGDGYLVTGHTASGISGTRDVSLRGGNDLWILRLDAGGSLNWQMLAGGTGSDTDVQPVRMANGDFILTANSNSGVGYEHSANPLGGTDFWALRYKGDQSQATLKTFTVSGKVFLDENSDCVDNTEKGMAYHMVQNSAGRFAITDKHGDYVFKTTDQIELTYSPAVPRFWTNNCPDFTFKFGEVGPISQTADFGLKQDTSCALLRVSIGHNRFRVCFTNNVYVINYCNDGNTASEPAWIEMDWHPFLTPLSSTVAWRTPVADNKYIFDIGVVEPGECGTIYVTYGVDCRAGFHKILCNTAKIYPASHCEPTNEEWDKSSTQVTGVCKNKVAVFTISNTGDPGDGDMEGSAEYRIYIDNKLAETGTYQLNGGESLTIEVEATSNNIRLEADQRPGHPGKSRPRATVVNCTGSGWLHVREINAVPKDDADPFVDTDCGETWASYDPNDKAVTPSGITENNYIPTGSLLSYKIRFQNVGNDTAFTVVVRDTMDVDLNMTTLKIGAASHDFDIAIEDQALVWTFNNILLVDSITNEPASHGWITYYVQPKDDLPPKTIIENKAAIYFDYNEPVITNLTSVSIFDTVLVSETGVILSTTTGDELNWSVYPNPADNQLTISSEQKGTYRMYSLLGTVTASGTLSRGSTTTVAVDKLPRGIYFLEVSANGITQTQKVVLH